jgi:glycosyltransferase involved in cell wall biosynthesis
MVLFEAMAAGVPIVATAVGGVPDVLTESDAWLVPSDDPAALANAIELAKAQPEERDRRARSARERLEQRFGLAPWLARYERLYRQVQRRRKTG